MCIEKNGPWVTNGGYEYNAVLIALVLAIVEAGPGIPSLDVARGRERKGAGWAAMALGVASLGAYGVDARAARRLPEPAKIAVASDERAAA